MFCVALVVAACGLVPAASERDAVASYVWSKRGADAGDMMRLYCLAGSARERRWMYESLAYHAAPATVTIACPD